MAGSSGTIRRAIKASVNAITLAIKAAIDAVTTSVQTLVDAITATVQAIFDTVAAIIDVVGNGIGILSHYCAAQEKHSSDKHPGLGCVPYSPCIHVITPEIRMFYFSLYVQRAVSTRVDTEQRPFPIIVKLACKPAFWQAHVSLNKDKQWPWQSPPPPTSTHSFAGIASA